MSKGRMSLLECNKRLRLLLELETVLKDYEDEKQVPETLCKTVMKALSSVRDESERETGYRAIFAAGNVFRAYIGVLRADLLDKHQEAAVAGENVYNWTLKKALIIAAQGRGLKRPEDNAEMVYQTMYHCCKEKGERTEVWQDKFLTGSQVLVRDICDPIPPENGTWLEELPYFNWRVERTIRCEGFSTTCWAIGGLYDVLIENGAIQPTPEEAEHCGVINRCRRGYIKRKNYIFGKQ